MPRALIRADQTTGQTGGTTGHAEGCEAGDELGIDELERARGKKDEGERAPENDDDVRHTSDRQYTDDFYRLDRLNSSDRRMTSMLKRRDFISGAAATVGAMTV